MPIYMDRHIIPGIQAQQAAEAHRQDLSVQDEFGCRTMTYWVDEERGSAFCLIDAPDIETVRKLHHKAHGLIPHDIVQVNSNVVEAFLGRISDPEGCSEMPDGLKVFNDPAFRIILVAQTTDMGLLQHQLGKERARKMMVLFHEIMRRELYVYEGREIESKDQVFIASFVSVTQAVGCAAAVQKGLHVAGEIINLRMGVNAGMPVEKSRDLFGDTIKTAKHLIAFAKENQVVLASIIKEIYKDDGQRNIDHKDYFRWVNSTAESFLQRLMDALSNSGNNPKWNVNDFCSRFSMSKSKFYRRCIELTGMSPNKLIREYRLLQSLDLLKTGRNISQTVFDVGFNSPSYFTKCFQERFGIQPTTYLKYLA